MSNKTPKESAEKTELVPRHIKALFLLVVVLGVLLVVVGALSLQSSSTQNQNTQPTQTTQQDSSSKLIGRIGEGYFNFEVADDNTERYQGLSGRDPLPATDAMLFVFDTSSEHCFVMRGMKFNLDMLWFDQDFNLVHQESNVSPDSYPDQQFCPPVPAKYVVEVTAGVAEANQITKDSKLEIEL